MTKNDFIMLLPLFAMSISIVAIMLVVPFYRSHKLALGLTMGTLLLCFVLLPVPLRSLSPDIGVLLTFDGYAVFFIGVFLAAAAAVALLSYGYMEKRRNVKEEFYILLLIATLGSSIIVSSRHFASLFLGLELLSVSLYVLISYLRSSNLHFEAAIKYLILTSMSISFLLFGMALIYTELGTMDFPEISRMLNSSGHARLMLSAGLLLFLIGIGFKLAVVPFHLWTPDVYQGAPAPVAAFIATVSKGAVFAFLLRYLSMVEVNNLGPLSVVLAIIAAASMIVGNILALLQTNMKRLLAYSSISHLGYMLVALLAGGSQAVFALAFYLVAYSITTMAAFGVICVLSAKERDYDDLSEYRGLAYQHSGLAALLTAALLSLAGIPVTAGFIGKFFLFSAGVGAKLWLLVIIFAAGSAIGLFYYLRVIVFLYTRPGVEYVLIPREGRIIAPSFSLAAGVTMTILAFLLVLLGIFPSPLIRLIQALAINLS